MFGLLEKISVYRVGSTIFLYKKVSKALKISAYKSKLFFLLRILSIFFVTICCEWNLSHNTPTKSQPKLQNAISKEIIDEKLAYGRMRSRGFLPSVALQIS